MNAYLHQDSYVWDTKLTCSTPLPGLCTKGGQHHQFYRRDTSDTLLGSAGEESWRVVPTTVVVSAATADGLLACHCPEGIGYSLL